MPSLSLVIRPLAVPVNPTSLRSKVTLGVVVPLVISKPVPTVTSVTVPEPPPPPDPKPASAAERDTSVGKSVIDEVVIEIAPPKVRLPEVVTVPDNVSPLTVPVPPTEVTVPVFVV